MSGPDVARRYAVGMFFLECQRHDLASVEARQLCFSVGLVCAQDEKLVRHERDRQARAGVIYLVDFFWQERLLRKSGEARLADVNFARRCIVSLAPALAPLCNLPLRYSASAL